MRIRTREAIPQHWCLIMGNYGVMLRTILLVIVLFVHISVDILLLLLLSLFLLLFCYFAWIDWCKQHAIKMQSPVIWKTMSHPLYSMHLIALLRVTCNVNHYPEMLGHLGMSLLTNHDSRLFLSRWSHYLPSLNLKVSNGWSWHHLSPSSRCREMSPEFARFLHSPKRRR